MAENGRDFKYKSYVQDIMGPLFFDYGFGPFRWVVCSGDPAELQKTDDIACKVLEEMQTSSPADIKSQMADNVQWIRGAQQNKLVVGSQARILYADAEGRTKIATEFNNAVRDGRLKAPVSWVVIIMMFLGQTLHTERHRTSTMVRNLRLTCLCRTSWAMPSEVRLGCLCTMEEALVGARSATVALEWCSMDLLTARDVSRACFIGMSTTAFRVGVGHGMMGPQQPLSVLWKLSPC